MAALQTQNTILYAVREACKQLSLPIPTDIFGTNVGDATAQLMGSVANLAGIMVADAHQWEFLQDVLTCTGDGVTTEFALPANFSEIVGSTGWSDTIRRPVVVLNAQQWAAISSWLSQSFFVNPACRIYQDTVQFMSAIPNGSVVTFQYRKKAWVIDANDPLVFKEICDKNGDRPMFDWLLMILAIKMKYLEFKGMSNVGAQQDFNDRIAQLIQKNQMAPVLSLSGPMMGGFRYLDNFFNTPDTNLGG
jgi:hypothetical protein